MKKLLTGLAVVPFVTTVALAAGVGGGSGGGNPPPPPPPAPQGPFPIVVFKTQQVDISNASLQILSTLAPAHLARERSFVQVHSLRSMPRASRLITLSAPRR
jgi:hypothetical protein